jgi:histidinol dehydrogenase
MRILQHASKSFSDELAAFCRSAAAPREIAEAVTSILADVRARGDEAVSYYAAKFDGAKLRAREFRLNPADLPAATKRVPAADLKALEAARDSVIAFNRRGLPKAIRRVGLYVPGGEVPLVSTVLMTAPLARLAGCPEIAVFTPSNPEGKVADGLLAALHLCGITEVYRVGGVQAVGAMAYGTPVIPAVDKIFGPGNAYVCEAKRQVFGTVGVDSLPGPSEVMVIADESADVAFVAADLLAQAEHGSGREKIYLVSNSGTLLSSVASEIRTQLQLITRGDKAMRVLEQGLLAIQVETLAQAAEIANYVAPEHLELLVPETAARKLVAAVTTAGAIMVGPYSPTALGDFVAGPSHVLPTGRTGRFLSGLRVSDFIRRTSVIRYDKAGVRKAEPLVAAFAGLERLDAHGRSVRIRVR